MTNDPRNENRCAAYGNWYDDNCFVIVAKQPDKLRAFFESMGLTFEAEQHRSGPKHWAAMNGQYVLEIYPPKNNNSR